MHGLKIGKFKLTFCFQLTLYTEGLAFMLHSKYTSAPSLMPELILCWFVPNSKLTTGTSESSCILSRVERDERERQESGEQQFFHYWIKLSHFDSFRRLFHPHFAFSASADLKLFFFCIFRYFSVSGSDGSRAKKNINSLFYARKTFY